ncbi:tubulin-specific chaperone D-like [Tachypleus tridentatus]|uniref:tubulin-specific chaperone D-like n=1 Tax=Tachypleus tridentatus TaxID=6853 RepID=UPI003FD641FD
MAAIGGEDNFESEAVGLGCALELFKEHEEVAQIIKRLPDVYRDSAILDITYERFIYILSQYQEQPHLLDPYLDTLLENLLNIGRDSSFPVGLRHKAFQFLYIVTKVRNYKVVVRHLPHEVADVEPVLSLLAEQDPFDHETWETRYILLLWLSIIVMIPFHMGRLDSNNKFNEGQKKPIMERISDVIKLYLSVGDKVQDAAAFLAARFITRPDVKEVHFFSFLKWTLKLFSLWKAFDYFFFPVCSMNLQVHATATPLLHLGPYISTFFTCMMDSIMHCPPCWAETILQAHNGMFPFLNYQNWSLLF